MIAALLYNNLAMTSPYWCPPSRLCLLTHWGRNKMPGILQITFQIHFSLMKSFCILLQISLKYVPKGPIDYLSAVVWVTAWCWTGKRTSSEPMIAIETSCLYHSEQKGAIEMLWWHTRIPTVIIEHNISATRATISVICQHHARLEILEIIEDACNFCFCYQVPCLCFQ